MRKYFGEPGHFIASKRCRFHIHTHVRDFCVSTVGEYYPRGNDIMEPIGSTDPGQYYETMVFRLEEEDGSLVPDYANPLETSRCSTPQDANHIHETLVRNYEGCVEHEECREHVEMAMACRGVVPMPLEKRSTST